MAPISISSTGSPERIDVAPLAAAAGVLRSNIWLESNSIEPNRCGSLWVGSPTPAIFFKDCLSSYGERTEVAMASGPNELAASLLSSAGQSSGLLIRRS